MKVIIVGAGIGGSALALSLAKLGVDYVLLEQAPAFTEVGAGIQLSPNGVRVLETLGLSDALAGFCTEPDFHKYSVWDTGETILRTPLRPRVRQAYGYAYYHAPPGRFDHRADWRLGSVAASVAVQGRRCRAECHAGLGGLRNR